MRDPAQTIPRAIRLALLVTLGLNDLALDAAETEAATVIIRVAGGEMDEAVFADWVAAHVVAAEG